MPAVRHVRIIACFDTLPAISYGLLPNESFLFDAAPSLNIKPPVIVLEIDCGDTLLFDWLRIDL